MLQSLIKNREGFHSHVDKIFGRNIMIIVIFMKNKEPDKLINMNEIALINLSLKAIDLSATMILLREVLAMRMEEKYFKRFKIGEERTKIIKK